MATSKKTRSYQEMADELNQLVSWFESDQVNLDEAVAKYEQALELLDQMETYLRSAQNKVKKIAVKFDSE